MNSIRRFAVGATAPLLLAGLLVGCGSSDPEPPAPAQPSVVAVDGSCEEVPNGTAFNRTIAPPDSGDRDISTMPEVATGFRSDMVPVAARDYAAATANPLATAAACEVLRDGGTAADALVAAQLVLGLAEPQSSGIGGGAFLLYFDAASGEIEVYDGRETAPAAATPDYLRHISAQDQREPLPDARSSGRSIGVPGVLRLLESAHADHGKAPWAELFQPAITLSDNGFDISDRLAAAIADSATDLVGDPESAAYFLNPDGSPKTAGTVLTNPGYAKTLTTVAAEGAEGFYTGPVAEAIVAAATSDSNGRTPSLMTLEDLSSYSVAIREPLCTRYRESEVCGMPNPSSGGIAVASTLGILENFDLAQYPPTDIDRNGGRPDPQAVHLVAEAERLAYADRDKYVADPAFVPLPGGSPAALTDPDYLRERSDLIDPDTSMGTATAGDFGPVQFGVAPDLENGTSHLTIADSYGNVAVMTTTIESAFGSFHMVDGFLLNNELTDFAAQPTDAAGAPVANIVQPGKRPRSSMAPTLVFDTNDDGSRGDLSFAVGSPGGSVIIQFVVKTLVGVLDWGLDPQQAISLPAFGAANTETTNVGGEHPAIDPTDDGANDPLVQGLTERGHTVSVAPQSSGLSAVQRTDSGWLGGADPRREGAVMGG